MEWPQNCSVCGLQLGASYLAHVDAGFPAASAEPSVVAAYCGRACLESAELYEPIVPVDDPDGPSI
jgi:hypothetical protein